MREAIRRHTLTGIARERADPAREAMGVRAGEEAAAAARVQAARVGALGRNGLAGDGWVAGRSLLYCGVGFASGGKLGASGLSIEERGGAHEARPVTRRRRSTCAARARHGPAGG